MRKFFLLTLFLVLITGCVNNTVEIADYNTKQEININQEALQSGGQANIMEKAKIKTSLGDIVVELDSEKAPITVENFKNYIASGFYGETLFHRVMPGFMIQGGGFDTEKAQKETNAPIKNEAKNGLKNDRGTIAMARTMVVDSATSQFFINLVDNGMLNYQSESNYGYAVFGRVTEGMEVVDEIAKVQTGNNGPHQNWPVEDVVINSIELVK